MNICLRENRGLWKKTAVPWDRPAKQKEMRIMNTTAKALNLDEMEKVAGGAYFSITDDILLCTLGGPVGQIICIVDRLTDTDGEKTPAETGRRRSRS